MSDKPFELVPEPVYKMLIIKDLPLLGWKKGQYVEFTGKTVDFNVTLDEIVKSGYAITVRIEE
ncbi:hypothetical protein N9937_01825 [bacterium]|nr:hypothetical protein [bacterium]